MARDKEAEGVVFPEPRYELQEEEPEELNEHFILNEIFIYLKTLDFKEQFMKNSHHLVLFPFKTYLLSNSILVIG